MNYKTCTFEELTNHTSHTIDWAEKNLHDSHKSRAAMVNETVGYFLGVCAVRAFDYDFKKVEAWREIAFNN